MKILVCDSPTFDASGIPSCTAWQMVEYESLATSSDIERLVQFDGATFSVIVTGCLLTFISAHVAGIVVKTMNRT